MYVVTKEWDQEVLTNGETSQLHCTLTAVVERTEQFEVPLQFDWQSAHTWVLGGGTLRDKIRRPENKICGYTQDRSDCHD